MRVPDHGKQRPILWFTVNGVIGVEYLVPTMLGIALRKHHQFGIGRISAHLGESIDEVFHFCPGKGQTQRLIVFLELLQPVGQDINATQRSRIIVGEQTLSFLNRAYDSLDHSIMQKRLDFGSHATE